MSEPRSSLTQNVIERFATVVRGKKLLADRIGRGRLSIRKNMVDGEQSFPFDNGDGGDHQNGSDVHRHQKIKFGHDVIEQLINELNALRGFKLKR